MDKKTVDRGFTTVNRKKEMSLVTKVKLIVVVIIFTITTSIGVFSYIIHRNDAIRNNSDRAMAIAKATAMSITPDELWHAINTNEKNEHYEHLQKQFNRTKVYENLLSYYAGTFDPETGMTMYLQAYEEIEANYFNLNDTVPLSIFPQAAHDAFHSGQPRVTDVYKLNIDGSMGLFAYSPIFDENQKPIGLICVSISLKEALSRSKGLALTMMIGIFIFVVVIIWVPIFYIRQSVSKSLLSLQEVNQDTQTVLNAMPFGISIWDKNAVLVDCNQATLDLLRISSKQEYLERCEDYWPEYQPDGVLSIDAAREHINKAGEEGSIFIEWVHKAQDGELIPCELTCVRINYKDDYYFVAYFRDLRERDRMLREIKDSSLENELQLTKLNLVIKATKIALWEKKAVEEDEDPVNESNIVMYSDEFRQMLGYENKTDFPDIVESWSSLLHPDDKERILNALANHLQDKTGKTPFDVEYRLMKKNGEYGYFHATGETIRDEYGIPARTAGALIDITESKRLIQEIEKQRIAAEAASRAKSNFLSNMSHEIRTPMNAIIGMTYIGKSAVDVKQKDDCLLKIENASQHLLGVINDILDMSKIEANKFELSYEEFDFEKMLQRVVNVAAFRADEKKQNLTVHIDKSIPRTLIGDDQRLAQVITNLLGNAVKFTPEEGFVRLETRSLGKTDGVYTIQITIKDSGIGISDEQQRKLFQSFQQAESGTSRKFGGTGLGLVISKNIIELMGGEIWVESDLGKGSSFSFTFKAKRGLRQSVGLSEFGVNWNNITIMAVDDDPAILEYFVDVIKGFGTTCDTALSGEEALAHIGKNGLYHIYFVDWKMPGMDGIKLAREIKATDKDDNSIIIMISAAEWSGIADEAKKAGVDKFLSKPLFPSAIADIIAEVIGLNYLPKEDTTDHCGIFKGYKVLLAEDVDINREIIEALVEPTLLEMDFAVNGLEAVAKFESSPDAYDLILMDVQMPEMDGYEATRKIRQIENKLKLSDNNPLELERRTSDQLLKRSRGVPIVAMTANVFKEDIERCLEAGMNDHIGKPVDVEEFFNTLRKYLVSVHKLG